MPLDSKVEILQFIEDQNTEFGPSELRYLAKTIYDNI